MNLLARLVFIALSAISLSSCDEEWSWNQKITISVLTPSGTKVASSVQRGTIIKYGWWQHQWGYDGTEYLRGEAVALEVAPGKFLFALLSGTPRAWAVFVPKEKLREAAGPALASLREAREVPAKDYPMFVMFEDIDDPASVKHVNPNRLDAILGTGYRLTSITITLTTEPVTDGRLGHVLSWLSTHKGKLKPSAKKYADQLSFEETLYGSDFQRPLD